MAGDIFDDFLEYDVGMGGGAVECPSCGEKVPYSVLIDDVIECPKCGKKFHIDGNGDEDEGEDDNDDGEDK